MLKNFKRKITILISSVALLMPLAVPVAVGAATIQDNLCSGVNFDTNTSATCNPDDPDASGKTSTSKLNSTLKLVINIFSIVVGVVSVIMIIIGGLKYITSSGDSGNITSAKNTILYAIVGLVIVALAQFIVRFVLTKVAGTGADVVTP